MITKYNSINKQIITEKFEYGDLLTIKLTGTYKDFIKFEDILINNNFTYLCGSKRLVKENMGILRDVLSLIFVLIPYNNNIERVYISNTYNRELKRLSDFNSKKSYSITSEDFNNISKLLEKKPDYSPKKIIKEFKEFKI